MKGRQNQNLAVVSHYTSKGGLEGMHVRKLGVMCVRKRGAPRKGKRWRHEIESGAESGLTGRTVCTVAVSEIKTGARV